MLALALRCGIKMIWLLKNEQEWRQLDHQFCDAFGGEKDAIIKEEDSFANFFLGYELPFCMFNDKVKEGVNRKDRKGKKQAAYRINGRDEIVENVGSILGYKFDIKIDEKAYINA